MKKLGVNAACYFADFSKTEAVIEFGENAIEYLGGIDLLVNNAGMLARDTIFEITPERMLTVFQVNTVAPFALLQHCAKDMVANKVKGSIVNISSIAATYTQPRGVAYASSKASMNKFTQNAVRELAEYNIRVNTVAPGVIASGMNETTEVANPTVWEEYSNNIPMKRMGNPGDIANAVLFLLSDGASWVTGKIIEVDGGQVL